jgi:hypothetical protein
MTIDRDGRSKIVTVTLLHATRPPFGVAATPEGDDLWLSAEALPAATGWELKPEGLCQADRCVRVPHGVALVRKDHSTAMGRQDQVNLTALAGLLGQPVIRDPAHAVWCFGEAAPARRAAWQSLQAPDFTLPDLDGRPHSLSDYRGKKVFLVSWASW